MNFSATKVTFYAVTYQEMRQVAHRYGYALALHGSLQKDLDVVAVPWTEDAAEPYELVRALCESVGGMIIPGAQRIKETWVDSPDPKPKPHGRYVWTIHLGGSGGYVDLGVMHLHREKPDPEYCI